MFFRDQYSSLVDGGGVSWKSFIFFLFLNLTIYSNHHQSPIVLLILKQSYHHIHQLIKLYGDGNHHHHHLMTVQVENGFKGDDDGLLPSYLPLSYLDYYGHDHHLQIP